MIAKLVFSLQFKDTELKMSCEMRQNEEGDLQTGNGNEVLNYQTEGEEDNKEENSNNKSEGMEETNSNTSERKEKKGNKKKLISFFIKKWNSRKHPSKRTARQKPVETPSEDLKGEVKDEQGEDIGLAELKGDEEPKRNSKRNTDDEETTQMGNSAEDEGLMREDRREERLQASGEEGDGENVETDSLNNNHTTVSGVKSGEDEEAQENKDSNT